MLRRLQGRDISPREAIRRLFGFGMHEESPPVMHLTVHLPGEQVIYFSDERDTVEVRQRIEHSSSTWMAFFKYNAENEDGHQYLYHEFPEHFTYDRRKREWHRRRRGSFIGCMYHCSPLAGEWFYLRLLLTTVRRPRSFDDLRTVNGHSLLDL